MLTVDDWVAHVDRSIREYKEKHPDRRVIMDEMNRLVLPDEVNKYGKAYRVQRMRGSFEGCESTPGSLGKDRGA